MPATLPIATSLAPHQMLRAIAAPDAPVVLDLRLAEDRTLHPMRLPGARSLPFDDHDAQVGLATGRGAVVICHKGQKISQGAAARLRAKGIPASVLEGGVVGWQAAGLPGLGGPGPDLIALPDDLGPTGRVWAWAHHRFNAPWAEVIEVPGAHLPGVLARFGAYCPDGLMDLAAIPALSRIEALAQDGADALLAQLGPANSLSQSFACCDAAFRGLCHE